MTGCRQLVAELATLNRRVAATLQAVFGVIVAKQSRNHVDSMYGQEHATLIDVEIISEGWSLEGNVNPIATSISYPLTRPRIRIGRASECELILSSDLVSKAHAELMVTGSLVIVRDRKSTNGTFVNGTRITQPTIVEDGDFIEFADCEFMLSRQKSENSVATQLDNNLDVHWQMSRFNQLFEDQRLQMVYQPLVMSDDKSIFGYEALATSSVENLETAGQIFAAAERLGAETRISEFCRYHAVKEASRAKLAKLLFVNTHPAEGLGEQLLRHLESLRLLAPNLPIVIELHESTFTKLEQIKTFRAALRDLNMGLAFDDFGAGHSRLLQLAECPPDYLKFDRAMVNGLSSRSNSQIRMLWTLVELCRDYNVSTIAEGLDNPLDIQLCHDLGFDIVQGFATGRPDALPSSNS